MSWYRFIDLAADDQTQNVVSTRTVTSQATCKEMKLTYGGYAGFQNINNETLQFYVEWIDLAGVRQGAYVENVVTGQTTWMSNTTSDCGPRCVQIIALQNANNVSTTDPTLLQGQVGIPTPKIWACNNTVGQITGLDTSGFDNTSQLVLPDAQATYLAGGVGWTGIDDNTTLQKATFNGDTIYNPNGDVDASSMANLVMWFSSGALAAMDNYQGPRLNLTGSQMPGPAQVVNIKWPYAGAILAGIPFVQFIMLLGVVRYASKAIILEPSFMTAAHILYPVIRKVGKDGCLFSVEEMAERLGPDYKISFNVRPDPNDPGHHDTTFVRDLDVIEEKEGFGYIRGRFPEGRYD
jgi:hypothetical protein